MLTEPKDMKSEVRENMRGGGGSVVITDIIPKESLPPKNRLSAVVTLKKGCGIGAHQHIGEEEIYYCLSGEGILGDNDVKKVIKKGDCHICKDGSSHSVHNEKDEPLELLAVIILNN